MPLSLLDAQKPATARRMLMELCEADLRCLDAHANLGNLRFDRSPAEAMRHYEAGLRIGELSLADPADGLLPWAWIDNRPFRGNPHKLGHPPRSPHHPRRPAFAYNHVQELRIYCKRM